MPPASKERIEKYRCLLTNHIDMSNSGVQSLSSSLPEIARVHEKLKGKVAVVTGMIMATASLFMGRLIKVVSLL